MNEFIKNFWETDTNACAVFFTQTLVLTCSDCLAQFREIDVVVVDTHKKRERVNFGIKVQQLEKNDHFIAED